MLNPPQGSPAQVRPGLSVHPDDAAPGGDDGCACEDGVLSSNGAVGSPMTLSDGSEVITSSVSFYVE